MGRILNSNNAAPVVPIGGAIYRNTAQAGVVSYADGTQYIPSTGSAVMSATDYPIYVATATASLSSLPSASTTAGYVSNGTLSAVPASVVFNTGPQYMPDTSSNARMYYPFSGQTSKNYFMGSTATSGSTAVVTFCRAGYRTNTTIDIPAYAFNTSGTLLSSPTKKAIYTWYDSTTSTFRIIGSDSSNDMKLFTSSDGVTWTTTAITSSSSGGNTFVWQRMGTSSLYNVSQVHSGQKVFMTTNNDGGGGYALWCSTNNGATFTDRTDNLVGGGTWYFGGSGSNQYINLNYNGTTLFMPYSGYWKYSTDDGVTWTASTISGVTTSVDNNAVGAIRGGDSSTFMYIFSSAVTSNRVYITTNGGQSFTTYSWTPAVSISASYPQITGAYDGSSRWCFAYATTSGIVVATSTNNGSTWTHTAVTNTFYSGAFVMAYLDDAFYLGNSSFGILRSTNGTTWTQITKSVTFPTYGQPYYSLTDAVVFGNWVIKKSNQATYNINSSVLIGNVSGYYANFGNYIASDLFVRAQPYTSTDVYQLISSSNVFNSSVFSPPVYSGQQSTNNATNIEYWRIK